MSEDLDFALVGTSQKQDLKEILTALGIQCEDEPNHQHLVTACMDLHLLQRIRDAVERNAARNYSRGWKEKEHEHHD
jgi:hypothetical protein